MNEPEFIRGNQKTYIRILCEENMMDNYEYRMCLHNEPESLLKFQQRIQNGESYMYYEVSGMQSLDILLQLRTLKRPLAITMIKAIIKLCKDFSEYVLDINRVVWNARYIMMDSNNDEIRFAYAFSNKGEGQKEYYDFEKFWEFCIEYLDYQDEVLMVQMYQVYEVLLDQKEKFILLREMEAILGKLVSEEPVEENATEIQMMLPELEKTTDPFMEDREKRLVTMVEKQSKVHIKESKNLKRGLIFLLILDVCMPVLWTPMTVLKIFLAAVAGIILIGMIIYVYWQERHHRKVQKKKEEQTEFMEEYDDIIDHYSIGQGETCLLTFEDGKGALYSLQNTEPQCIYINDSRKLIGKDSEKAQVVLEHDGVSRVHALVYKVDGKCLIEDLNSKNGTLVNGRYLTPREPYELQEGDKVRFAGTEYIFR